MKIVLSIHPGTFSNMLEIIYISEEVYTVYMYVYTAHGQLQQFLQCRATYNMQ